MHLLGYCFILLPNVSNNITLDCCNSTTDGADNYKGKYKFGKALAGKREIQNCAYIGSSNSSSGAFVNCIPDLEDGPSYGSLNVTSCQAKYKTTKELEKLQEVIMPRVNLFLKNTVMQAMNKRWK